VISLEQTRPRLSNNHSIQEDETKFPLLLIDIDILGNQAYTPVATDDFVMSWKWTEIGYLMGTDQNCVNFRGFVRYMLKIAAEKSL
jgi:hypothetical protein